ncbi:c-type cytochrome [Methylolobus aquaticus]|uniref:c-type cytochrome n=1 Tax=Methylotetracoccus oryzae TaxID=1919059 RepID=UPI001118832A|nr:c-type cytochrome [Methylotetracoccus oryzae]
MTRILWVLLSAAAALAAPVALGAGDPTEGKQKAESCGGCHGPDGNGAAPIFPKLAGQHASYLTKQLHDFKTEKRPEPTMTAMALALSDDDMADIGAFYAAQAVQVEAAQENELGRTIYRAGDPQRGVPACTGCHGPEAKGNEPAGYPALRGQYAAYLSKTLHDFKGKARYNDTNEMMRVVAAHLTDEEITGLSEYIAGLR